MEKTKQFNTYTDFLHDRKFVLWILTGDEQLERHWKEFLNEHPECTDSFHEAMQHATNIKFNEARLSGEEYETLRLRIHASLRTIRKRRKRLRFTWWGVAICVLLFGVVFYLSRSEGPTEPVAGEELLAVVTERLDDEDIRFFHDDTLVSFTENIRLLMRRDGSAVVSGADETEWIEKVEGDKNELVVPYGKRSKVKLEDGTEVWLNSGSSLKFPARFSAKSREVTLSGEMYIEVVPDSLRPFIVHTKHFDVHVHGTRFDLSAYNERVIPYCVLVEGEVVVHAKSGEAAVMEVGDLVAFREQQLQKRKVHPTKYICWKDGYLELDDTSLGDVLLQVERYYNLAFEYKNKAHLNQKKASGKIYLSENMNNVLSAISLLYSVDFTFSNQEESP